MIDPILKRAADTYGVNSQSVIYMEEAAELTKELSKKMRGFQNEDKIAEEIADVEIMLEQLKYLFGIENDVELNRQYKIYRLERRLNEEQSML